MIRPSVAEPADVTLACRYNNNSRCSVFTPRLLKDYIRPLAYVCKTKSKDTSGIYPISLFFDEFVPEGTKEESVGSKLVAQLMNMTAQQFCSQRHKGTVDSLGGIHLFI